MFFLRISGSESLCCPGWYLGISRVRSVASKFLIRIISVQIQSVNFCGWVAGSSGLRGQHKSQLLKKLMGVRANGITFAALVFNNSVRAFANKIKYSDVSDSEGAASILRLGGGNLG